MPIKTKKLPGPQPIAAKPQNLLSDVQLLQSSGLTMAPAALWEFLGERKDQPYVPFSAQVDLFNKIRVPWPGLNAKGLPYPTIFGVCCGRRFGKTTVGEKLLWQGLMAPDDRFGPPTVRLTADTEEHGQKIWRKFIWHLENTALNVLLDSYSREYQLVTLKTGATAQLLSANNPQALSGDGVTLWIVDEAQFLSWPAWENLFPSTAERDGIVVLLGVAEGEGPFREICYKGESDDYPEYLTLNYATASNPFVPRWRIEFARRTIPPHRFKQLYLAQWVNEFGAIFRNIDGCILPDQITVSDYGHGYIQPPLPGHRYYGGLDLARLSDWTVFTIWDSTGRLVAWDRYSAVSWELQKARAAALSALYGHPSTIVDSTGVGDPIFEDLIRLGMNVTGYQISTNERKRVLVDELAVRIGSGQVRFPRVPVFIEELRKFEARRSKTGSVVVYEAPSGTNDDFVMSAALAMQILPRPSVSQLYLPNPELIAHIEQQNERHQSASEFI